MLLLKRYPMKLRQQVEYPVIFSNDVYIEITGINVFVYGITCSVGHMYDLLAWLKLYQQVSPNT